MNTAQVTTSDETRCMRF